MPDYTRLRNMQIQQSVCWHFIRLPCSLNT